MDVSITGHSPVRGTVSVPADKAICHRAALLCAISRGTTEISPWASAEDCQRTLEIIGRLGVPVSVTDRGLRIEGVGLDGLRAPTALLDCGESGSTMRLACGLLAGQPFTATLAAAPSLCRRPMRRIADPLSQMGATVRGSQSGAGELHPPLTIHGHRPLRGISYIMPVASAQVKSALLIAGLYAEEPVTITEPVATRDHTERLLLRLGAVVSSSGQQVRVEPAKDGLVPPSALRVPGDLSSAAFLIVAAAVIPGSSLRIIGVSLNPTRWHWLNVLSRMGASIEREVDDDNWEPVGTLMIRHAPLHGISLSAAETALVIDELPILMVAACTAEGLTRFQALQELRVKETDRLHSMVTGLKALGAQIDVEAGADVTVAQSRLRGAVVDSFGDHRTAMSLAIAGLLADGPTRISGVECVRKSFGEFFTLLGRIAPGAIELLPAG